MTQLLVMGPILFQRIQLLRNLGQFDSVSTTQLALSKLTLIYAENGREAKTTLASIFRSAGSGDASIVLERQRLTTEQLPHVVLIDGTGPVIFQNCAWSRTVTDIEVFDDLFFAENVCSGVQVEADIARTCTN